MLVSGDCCENTCVSSAENECGVVEQSTSTGKTMVFIGFPNCTDPDAVKQIGGSQTLYNVLERGQVICGTYQSDFMTDFFESQVRSSRSDLEQRSIGTQVFSSLFQCQTLAAAVLGDKDAYIVDLWGSAVGINRFIALNEGKYDIVFGSDFLANRDIYEVRLLTEYVANIFVANIVSPSLRENRNLRSRMLLCPTTRLV